MHEIRFNGLNCGWDSVYCLSMIGAGTFLIRAALQRKKDYSDKIYIGLSGC
jgi:hypothetical protein